MDAKPISKAVKKVGSQAALAKALGIQRQAVYAWVNGLDVPIKHCPAIEKATNGEVKCVDLRPDFDWPVLLPCDDAI